MGIFNANQLLFFFLGVLATLFVFALVYLRANYPFRWHSTLCAVLGIVLTLFTIAWAISSLLENEARASGMGLLIFGVSSLVCLGLSRQLVLWEIKRRH